jgi:hypothetical protein
MTTEQKAWVLWEQGLDYASVASYALNHDLSMDRAIEEIYSKYEKGEKVI